MSEPTTRSNFERATVVSFESRKAAEMARLIEKQGGIPLTAPSMREVPLEDQTEAFEFAERLLRGEVDCLILLTGAGFLALMNALGTRYPVADIVEGLRSIKLICRGPKPQLALKQFNLTPELVAPEPNTTDILIKELDRCGLSVNGQRVEIQEYGERNLELAAALTARGARVTSVAVYMWQLPSDMGPLNEAIRQLVSGTVSLALFTSARQVVHLVEVAEQLGLVDDLLTSLKGKVVIASIGPVTTEALKEKGIPVDIEPPHPKMGSFVTYVASQWPTLRLKNQGAT
jgi:uroporphyrinogen-III synthase